MDHWLWQREDYAKAWVTILLSVNHATTKVLIKDHLYTVGPGQSVRSKASWAALFGKKWTRDRVRTFFGLLQDDGIITQQSDNRTTILTVCNWSTYQNQSPAEPQQIRQQSHSRATAEPQQSHTNNNDNNGNNEEQRQHFSATPLTIDNEDPFGPSESESDKSPAKTWHIASQESWYSQLKAYAQYLGQNSWSAWEALKNEYPIEAIIDELKRNGKQNPADIRMNLSRRGVTADDDDGIILE